MFKVTWKKQAANLVRKAAFAGLEDAGEFVLDESNKIVPHDEGTLQRSGEVSSNAAKMEVAISYDTPYAVRLHENPQYHFQGGRQGKWLETAIKKNVAEIKNHVASRVKSATKGGL